MFILQRVPLACSVIAFTMYFAAIAEAQVMRQIGDFAPIAIETFNESDPDVWWSSTIPPRWADFGIYISSHRSTIWRRRALTASSYTTSSISIVATYSSEFIKRNSPLLTLPVEAGAVKLAIVAKQRPDGLRLRVSGRLELEQDVFTILSPVVGLKKISDPSVDEHIGAVAGAIAKLSINGVSCTGFLVSTEMLATNYHCLDLTRSLAAGLMTRYAMKWASFSITLSLLVPGRRRGEHVSR